MVGIRILLFTFFVTTSLFGQEDSLIIYQLDNPKFLDASMDSYQLFFNGETHLRPENSERKKAFIKYISSRKNIDVLVIERSYAFGHWVNYYLETGDSLFLKEYLSINNFFSQTVHGVNEDEFAFYVWLRSFLIQNELSIEVVGIDLDYFPREKPNLWSMLKFSEQDSNLERSLPRSFLKAKKLFLRKKVSRQRMVCWVKRLNKELEGMESIENQAFANFVYNLNQSTFYGKLLSIKDNEQKREYETAKNFRRLIDSDKVVYGSYGLIHTSLIPYKPTFLDDTSQTFVSCLARDSVYKGKILSIGLIGIECDHNDEFPGNDIFSTFIPLEEYERLKSEVINLPHNTLYDLRGIDHDVRNAAQVWLVEQCISTEKKTSKE